MDDTPNAAGSDAGGSDALDRKLQIGRPEFGPALDGLRARMLAAAGGLAPRTIGRYRLGRVIGSGAFGTVHEAEDPELDRRVAIKVLGVRSAKEAARVVREAQLLATLSHPNVVQVFEVGTTDGGRSPYVVMELVEGPTLRAWMTEGSHGWREVVEVMLRVAQGLWAAHQAGIIHRDLKPENVLMGPGGRPRVIDFGLARSIGADEEGSEASRTLRSGANELGRSGSTGMTQLTATGQVMGTPAYMAPEVFAGEHTPLSDQYALCVVLYEALFGTRPFSADSPEELAAKVHAREAEPPADRRGVPRRVAAIALRGLRRATRERFGDVGELVAALEQMLRPRRRAAVILGVAVLGVSGLALGGFVLAGPGGGRAEPVATSVELAAAPTPDEMQAAAIAEIEGLALRVRRSLDRAELDAALEGSALLLERAQALDHGAMLAEASLLRGQALALATDYEHAVPLLENAYLLAEQADVPRVAMHAASELVGILGHQADQYEDAHRWKEHADVASRRAGLEPRRHPPYVLSVVGLMSREGEKTGAIAMLEEAIAEGERHGEASSLGHASLLKALGRELFFGGNPQAALVPAQRAVEIYAERVPGSLVHAAALDNVGVFLGALGRHEEALAHNHEALQIRRAVLGPEHIDLGRSYGNMGMVLGKLGRHDEAFANLDRAIELFTARLGPDNAGVGESYALRAAIHASRGPEGRADALRDYERAARIFDGAGVIFVKKAENARAAIRELGGTPPPAPSIPIPP